VFISYQWLRELTGTKLTPEELRERLTNVGLAVDAVDAHGDDHILDVEVPSNRGDCLSHVGIARELAVIEKSKVESPKSKVQKTTMRHCLSFWLPPTSRRNSSSTANTIIW
jgi:phenylalanyl-tRNA synthetase beta chain